MPLATPQTTPHVELGDLIAVAYDEALEFTRDEAAAMRIAALAISELLARTDNARAIRDLADADP